MLNSMSDNWAGIVTLSLSRDFMKKSLLRSTSAEREREREGGEEERSTFIYVKSKTDRKRGNHSYRNVNNNNHNNSLLFSRRLFDAAFSSEREWVERVEPHPLRAPFFLYHHCHLHPHLFLSSPSPPHPVYITLFPASSPRNIHWRLRYRLCALRRSRKSRMNRASFRDVPRALFPSKLSRAKKNANNAHYICTGRLHWILFTGWDYNLKKKKSFFSFFFATLRTRSVLLRAEF